MADPLVPLRAAQERARSNPPRARWTVEQDTDTRLVIRDIGHNQGCPTVTNDADAVVAALHRDGLGTRRLFYYDSMGQLDELVHDGEGRFLRFAPGPR